MLLANCPNLSLPVRRFYIEEIEGDFPAHFTGETWNGYECPVFTAAQVEEFLSVLNGNDDFEADLIDGVVIVNIFSSGDCLRIKSENGVYRFEGWCFKIMPDL